MSAPILVSGLSRCGTTLMMGMLDRGGVPVFSDNRSAYEHHELAAPDMRLLLPRLMGQAVKVLDPHRWDWPARVDASVIWMDREPTEQAKSQEKFIRLVVGVDLQDGAWKALRAMLGPDRLACMRLFDGAGARVLCVSFESVLADPHGTARTVQRFLGRDLDTDAMVGFVLKRSPRCAPDMAVELAAVAAEGSDS